MALVAALAGASTAQAFHDAAPSAAPPAAPVPGSTPAEPSSPALPAATETRRTSAFYIGHSLNSDIPDMVKALMDATPRESFRFREQFIPGAPLRWQWEEQAREPEKRARLERTHQGHWFDWLPDGSWNALVLVESVPRGAGEMEESREYAGRLVAEAVKANPRTRIFIYEPWHCIKSGTPEGCRFDATSPTRSLPWVERLAADGPMWDGLVRSLREAHPRQEITLIPAGRAFIPLVTAIGEGRVPGFASVEDLFEDDIHPNPYGKYFVACVHYAAMTGRSPVGLPWDIKDRWGRSYWFTRSWQGKEWPSPDPEAVRLMQTIAWQVVRPDPPRPATE